jgi:hypothetical protein
MAAKKATTPAAKQPEKGRRLPKSVRKHIRLLKSEGRYDEAAAMHKSQSDSQKKQGNS